MHDCFDHAQNNRSVVSVMKGDYFYDEPRISAIIEFVY